MKTQIHLLMMIVLTACLAGCASPTGGPNVAAAAPTGDPTPQTSPPADEEPLFNRLKWSTATEVDNFGFDIYRGPTEDGPFERITSTPIPGAGTVDEPRYYEFKDSDIDPTKDYYYYVESISIDGLREIFSPIIKAKAKRPVE